jgi:1,5-anhydro-D-fructose reductase (1,5-anhydro-D-mannitol-forming)
MQRPLSVAVLGFWHVHASDYARAVVEHPDTRLAAVWDSDAARGQAGADEFGVEFIADLDALLARNDIDAVTVTTSTDVHHEIISRAIAAGKHVFTEKLLAPTVDEAEAILGLAKARGTIVEVSLPRLYEASTVTALRLVREGKLGRLTYARVRIAHDGSLADWLPERFYNAQEAIGGALADLGCHAVYLVQQFLGAEPETVSATYSSVTGRAVEDNSVVTVAYRHGAIGVAEASFVTVPGAFAFELRGTEGSLLYGFGGDRMLAKGPHFDPESWTELETGDDEPGAFDRWVKAITAGQPDVENQRAAVDLTRLVVAANRSAATGSTLTY